MAGRDQFDSHEEHKKVPLRRKLAFGIGGMSESLIGDAILQSLYPYYNIILKVNGKKVGWALMFPRLWDAFTDPLMGHISDNTRTRWGRRRPYIAIGSIPLALFACLLWTPPLGLDVDGIWRYLVVICFFFYTSVTVAAVPYTSLGAELSIDYEERTRIQAYRGMFSRVGAALGNASFKFAHLKMFRGPRHGFSIFGVICGCTLIIAHWITALGTREEVEIQDQERMGMWSSLKIVMTNRPFLILAVFAFVFIVGVFGGFPLGTYVNIYYVYSGDTEASSTVVSVSGIVLQITSFLFVPIFAWIGNRVGKKTTLFWAIVLFGLAPISSWWLFTPEHPYLQLIFSSLLGIAVAAWLVFPLSMMADVCDVDELRTGRRREGAYMGFFAFLFKLGFSFTALFNAYCLDFAGFDEVLDVQTPETVRNIRLMLMWIPVFVILLSAAILYFYPLDPKRVHEIRETLEERRPNRKVQLESSGIL